MLKGIYEIVLKYPLPNPGMYYFGYLLRTFCFLAPPHTYFKLFYFPIVWRSLFQKRVMSTVIYVFFTVGGQVWVFFSSFAVNMSSMICQYANNVSYKCIWGKVKWLRYYTISSVIIRKLIATYLVWLDRATRTFSGFWIAYNMLGCLPTTSRVRLNKTRQQNQQKCLFYFIYFVTSIFYETSTVGFYIINNIL